MGQSPCSYSPDGCYCRNPLFPDFPPGTPPDYECLTHACLRMDPHERPAFTDIGFQLGSIMEQCWQNLEAQLGPGLHVLHGGGADVAHGAGSETLHVVGPDTQHEVGPDAQYEVGPDAQYEVGPDTQYMVGPDALYVVGPDAQHCGPGVCGSVSCFIDGSGGGSGGFHGGGGGSSLSPHPSAPELPGTTCAGLSPMTPTPLCPNYQELQVQESSLQAPPPCTQITRNT